MEPDDQKAILVPHNSKGEYFIQDRRGYKKPDWGYFGGGIEEGETPLETAIREAKEELDIEVVEDDLVYLGTTETEWEGKTLIKHVFLYRTDQEEFNVLEGQGGYWFSYEQALDHLIKKSQFEDIADRIKKVV